MKKTIVIESSYAFASQRRGIGVQLRTWLSKANWNKFKHIDFVLTHFNGKDFIQKLPNHVKIKKIHANSFKQYIKKIYKQISFDLIFFQTCSPELVTKNKATKVGISYGMENLYCRHYIPEEFSDNIINELERAFEEFDMIITVSKTTLKDLSWFFPEHRHKIKLVYTGVSSEMETTREKVIPKFNNQPYFLVFGYELKKNIIRIVQAFDNFKQQTKPKTKLIIVGKPGYGASRIDKTIHRLKNKKDIYTTGYISDVQRKWLLKNCKALIAIPIYEGFGITGLEGLYFHKPVLVSNNGSLKEVISKAGFLADPFSINDIKHKMVYIDKLKKNPKSKYIQERLNIYEQGKQTNKLLQLLTSLI